MVPRLSLLLATSACLLLAPGGVAHSKARPPVCKADADCVLVPADCCGCTGGGKQTAISCRAQAAHEREQRARCKDVVCTAVMSQHPSCSVASAMCKEGKCVLGK
jgi:hypothetical protein